MRRRSFLALAASLPLLRLPRPAAARTAQTPVAAGGDAELMALLRLLPDDVLLDDGQVRYANYGRQIAAMGFGDQRARLDFETWLEAARELGVPSAMDRAPVDAIWRDSLGFDARDLNLLLERTSISGTITIMRGTLGALTPARLGGMGYEPVETDGVTWYTIGDVNLLATDHYIHTLHMGYLRHMAILDDGTVVGTTETDAMERVLALHAGKTGSFAEGRGAALASSPDDLVLAEIEDGASLMPDLDPELVARLPRSDGKTEAEVAAELELDREEVARMPRIDLALLGLTAGWTREELRPANDAPRSRAVAVLVPADRADAEMIAETVTRRLTTEAMPESARIDEPSWVEAFPGMVIETAPGGTSVVVELTPVDGVPSTLLNHLRDLTHLPIFYWIGASADTDSG